MPRVLIVAHDVVGPSMAGPGIRYWEIAAALRRRGIETTLAAPAGSALEGVLTYRVGDETLPARASGQDALVVTGPILEQFPALKGLGVPLVVDMYDPFLFENLARRAGLDEHEGGLRTLAEQARCGDFFLCASERQRDLYLGMLAAWGRVNPLTHAADARLRSLVDVVPFGLAGEPPRPGPAARGVVPGIGADERVLLWNGGIWDWFDPETAIRAVARLADRRPGTRLLFLGTRHPNPAIGEPPAARRARALAADLGLADRVVFFRDWTAYEERGAYLLEADLAISLHVDGLETRYAHRTRLLDCIWAGLPAIVTEGDVIGDALAARGLARSVPPGSAPAVEEALAAMLDETDARAARRKGFGSLAAELTWDRAVEPLAAFVAAPRRAADRGAAPAPAAGPAERGPTGASPTGAEARSLWSRLRQAVR